MDSQKLKTFRCVATLLNFNHAAKTLNYAQSSVSAQIKSLEEEVGVSLFLRKGRSVVLTKAGERLLTYSHKLLAIEEEALTDLRGGGQSAGTLTLRVPQSIATYLLPQVLSVFQSKHPGIHLDVNSCALASLESELGSGSVDLAFLLAESVNTHRLATEVLKIVNLSMVAGSDHPLCEKSRVEYRDLQNYPLFLPKADCGYRKNFEQELLIKKVRPSAIMEFNSIEAIKKCIMQGSGITIIPDIAVETEIRQGNLVTLNWAAPMETAVIMIWHKKRWLSPVQISFMEMVRKAVR